jgi:two-component system sensor histidine kinase BaeS
MAMDFLGDVCQDAQPAFLKLFDLSIAPPLLYYSYVPIIIIALLIGLFIFYKDKRSLRSRLLLSFTIFFVLWVLNILVQWVAAYNSVIMFSWQITALFEVGMFLSTLYFAQVFLYDRDISFTEKLAMFGIATVTLFLLPTDLNVNAFDTQNCEGTNGPLWSAIYALEPAIIVLMIWQGIRAYRERAEKAVRKQIALFTVGIAIFLTAFFLSNFYGELTKFYEFNLWGPIGMVIFLALLSYLIVRYRAFDIKLIGAQALILSLIALIGSEFFFVHTAANQLLVAATLVITGFIGINLIRSVKKEVEQREHIEMLAGELQKTNEQQEGLIHFIGHEVKGFLTKDAGAFASLTEGDFGQLPETVKPFVEGALAQSRQGVDSVSSILKAANLKKGTVTYEKAPFDLKALAAEAVERARTSATQKGLALSFTAEDGEYQMTGDKAQINDHVLRNLIDNSINYTPSGSIAVSLAHEGSKLVFRVKDTGVGITEEDKARLFTEGGHGKDSQTINAHSTGYGLFIAKQITEAHGGTIRAESEGAGKGSTFVVEFPA